MVEHWPSKPGVTGSSPVARFPLSGLGAIVFSIVKTREREEARRLRRQDGLPIKEIARLLDVSTSSVSIWVRDIALTAEQLHALEQKNPALNRQLAGWAANSARARVRRETFQAEGRALALAGDAFHAAGCMLYWAEGSKSRNGVHFSNSDPEMVRFFVAFLREFFGVSDSAIRIDCNLFADHAARQREIEDFWLETLRLPRASLRKSTVNVYSKYSEKKRRNKLPYGTCRVNVHSTRIVQCIYGSIQAYAGIRRDEWLD